MDNILTSKEYQFLNNIENMILLGYGGSHAYGTNIETSDIDIRGIYMNNINEILGVEKDSEQFVDTETDTTIYSFKKMIKLLSDCNPNTIEILGLRDYLYISEAGQLLLDNKGMFLSKKAIYTFGQYANSQLNRLINKSGRGKSELISNEVRSLDKALESFKSRYKKYADTESLIKAYQENNEIYMEMYLKKLPMTVVVQMLNELVAINKDYTKSSRNDKAIAHDKLNKHMMHLLRLYMMGIDILNGEIITYREKEHNLLMDIRNYKYLEDDKMTPTKEFEQLLDEYRTKFNEEAARSKLPEKPDFNRINNIVIRINKMYI